MTIFGFRAIRAAIAVLRVGYSEQAVGHNRLLDELHGRAQKITEDASGDLARQWLDGHWNPKGAKLAGRDLWDMMSAPAHAGVRGVLDWIAVSNDDGTTSMVVGPEARPEVGNAMLTYMAGEGRDLALMLAKAAGKRLNLVELDARINSAHDLYVPDSQRKIRPVRDPDRPTTNSYTEAALRPAAASCLWRVEPRLARLLQLNEPGGALSRRP
jgi:hypothetical protein